MGTYQVLPFQVRVDLGAMAMKVYSPFPQNPKTPSLVQPHHIFSVIFRTFVGGGSYPSVEMQSVYSTAPPDFARMKVRYGRSGVERKRQIQVGDKNS